MNSRQALRSVLLLMTLVPPCVLACDCRNGSLSERIESSQIVFVAVVTEFKPLDHVTLRSKEVFKGRPDASMTIPAGMSDCDYFLPPISPRIGEAFLLFVGQLDRRLFVSRCQNSGPVLERMADLAELRRLSQLKAQSKNPAKIVR